MSDDGMILVPILLLALLACCTGCSTLPPGAQQPVPDQWLLECKAQEREIRVNGDLGHRILDYKEALRLCNNDKAAIREWSDALTKEK